MRQNGVAHTSGHGANGVHGGRQRQYALGWHKASCIFKSDNAIQGCRDANRAARVGAHANKGRASGHRNSSARRRATRHMALTVAQDGFVGNGIPSGRCAVVGVVAHAREGKLHHVGSPQKGASGLLQAGHGGAICLGSWRALKNRRAS